ncbi:hypothetical protein ACKKBG_A23365 [Auxenochlorella protothecoides x Auxenochlorella symbiontica]
MASCWIIATSQGEVDAVVPEGAGPSSDCVTQIQTVSDLCNAERDTVSLIYPRNATALPDQQQILDSLSSLLAAAQPSPGCCSGLGPVLVGKCLCTQEIQNAVDFAGFSSAYVSGVAQILGLACRLTPASC